MNSVFGNHASKHTDGLTAKVYSTPSCPYCVMAKRYLLQKGVQVQDIDVSQDSAAAMEMVQRTGQMGVPVVELSGELIVGFDRQRIDALLRSA